MRGALRGVWLLLVIAHAANTLVVYTPNITRSWVVNPAVNPLQYNHDSSIAFFKGAWVVVWNGNTVPKEGAPNQRNFMSVSTDAGVTWSPPQVAFSSANRSVNPVPCDPATCKQWQPNLVVSPDGQQLWCTWSCTGGASYSSVMTEPPAAGGRWTNSLITFPDPSTGGRSMFPALLNTTWVTFFSQDPVVLSTGRILAPVVLSDTNTSRAPDAPANVPDSQARRTRASVLISDDNGTTWRASEGTVYRLWGQWEPTVVEQADGSVLMLERNNDHRSVDGGGPPPDQRLLYATSHDAGVTWTRLQPVPLNTVCSRAHVLPLTAAGRRRYVMTINDWPSANDTFVQDRFNPAVYFASGDGVQYTAATGYAEPGELGMYPQMAVVGSRLWVAYSSGNNPRGIRVAALSAVPDAAAADFHFFPRTNVPPGANPVVSAAAVALFGRQWVESLAAPALPDGPHRVFAMGGWVRLGDTSRSAALFDSRSGHDGVLFGLADRQPFVFLSCTGDVVATANSTVLPPGQWVFVGAVVDVGAPSATFTTAYNGGVVGNQTVRLPACSANVSLTGTTAFLGFPRPANSAVAGFAGDVHSWAVAGGTAVTSVAQLLALANAAVNGTGQPAIAPAATPPPPPPSALAAVFDASVAASWKAWQLPGGLQEGVTAVGVSATGAGGFLTLCGQASAGVESCPLQSAADTSTLSFLFRLNHTLPAGAANVTVATVGTAATPVRLVLLAGTAATGGDGTVQAAVVAGNASSVRHTAPLGTVTPARWANATVSVTPGAVQVAVGGVAASVPFTARPVWTYVGEGYRQQHYVGTCLDVDVASAWQLPVRASCGHSDVRSSQ